MTRLTSLPVYCLVHGLTHGYISADLETSIDLAVMVVISTVFEDIINIPRL